MLRNGHVRLGGRSAETHQFNDWQGATGRPYTEHWTDEGKLYMRAVKDVYGNKIVGYSIGPPMKARLTVQPLENAVQMRGDVAGCIVHPDRGSQFRSRKSLHTRLQQRLVGSMGRIGACGNNAAMESSFALVQKNVLNRQRCATRDQLRIAIVVWIERTSHRRRKHASLRRLTPVEFEAITNTTIALAA